MMDFHRCIGCRFCMAACPYGARSFNCTDPRPFLQDRVNPQFPTRMKGVVEKCNFCDERLAEGKMPACVEASEAARWSSATWTTRTPRCARCCETNYTIRRKPDLGTEPAVYYIV